MRAKAPVDRRHQEEQLDLNVKGPSISARLSATPGFQVPVGLPADSGVLVVDGEAGQLSFTSMLRGLELQCIATESAPPQAAGGVAEGGGVKGCVAPHRQESVELIRFPFALLQEFRETSNQDALEPEDGDWALPTPRTSPDPSTPLGGSQQCQPSCSTAFCSTVLRHHRRVDLRFELGTVVAVLADQKSPDKGRYPRLRR
jgi:hypothetical protein